MGYLRTLTIAVLLGVTTLAPAQVLEDQVEVLLEQGEFEKAIEQTEAADDVNSRDGLFGRIAVAQVESGSLESAKSTLRRINDAGSLANACRNCGAAGGASGADFDTLINLITSTVAPNSWDDVGGPGAIESFDGGVHVDPQGVLRQVKVVKNAAGLRDTRDLAKKRANTGKLGLADPRRNSKLRMVSLTRLQREMQVRVAMGEAPTETMKRLAGLRSIRYVFLFPKTQELVIAGPAGDWSEGNPPGLLLDDLITLLRDTSLRTGEGAGQSKKHIIACDISPKRANLAATQRFLATPTGTLKPRQTPKWVDQIRDTLGLQDITIRGVSASSHVASVLVEADYHMKLVGMGLEPGVPGLETYLESIEPTEIPKSMDVLRWWFTLKSDCVRRNDEGDVWVFRDQVVRLQSENEALNAAGERSHTGTSSPLNQLFANRFTKQFPRLAKQYPVYARLEGLFKMSLLVALLENDKVRSQVDWDPSWLASTFETTQGRVPTEVPSIVNHRVINRRHVVVGVSGGVTLDPRAATRNVRLTSESSRVISDHESAQPRGPIHSPRWWWD